MNRKWLFAGALSAVIVLGVSSAALADDYCVRSHSRQNAYADRYSSYGSEGYGYTRPNDSYDRAYAYEGNSDTRYAGPGYGYYPETHSRYSQRAYQDSYGRQGYGGTVHEDHIRTTFHPFPFPHIDKRVVHHEHPVY